MALTFWQWVQSVLQGPAGPAGSVGPQGEQGPQGVPGPVTTYKKNSFIEVDLEEVTTHGGLISYEVVANNTTDKAIMPVWDFSGAELGYDVRVLRVDAVEGNPTHYNTFVYTLQINAEGGVDPLIIGLGGIFAP